jgi:hypothetical protein
MEVLTGIRILNKICGGLSLLRVDLTLLGGLGACPWCRIQLVAEEIFDLPPIFSLTSTFLLSRSSHDSRGSAEAEA